MIGLEYILYIYEMQHQELATYLKIRKQNINLWVSGKQNVSKKHIPKLVEIFGISEHFYQKELTEVDKLLIQKEKIVNELKNSSKLNQVKMDLDNLDGKSYDEVPVEDKKIVEINNKISKAEVNEIIEEKIPNSNMYLVKMVIELIEKNGDSLEFRDSMESFYKKYI
jgi:plasmid maintenance system antidote protein VapI